MAWVWVTVGFVVTAIVLAALYVAALFWSVPELEYEDEDCPRDVVID